MSFLAVLLGLSWSTTWPNLASWCLPSKIRSSPPSVIMDSCALVWSRLTSSPMGENKDPGNPGKKKLDLLALCFPMFSSWKWPKSPGDVQPFEKQLAARRAWPSGCRPWLWSSGAPALHDPRVLPRSAQWHPWDPHGIIQSRGWKIEGWFNQFHVD